MSQTKERVKRGELDPSTVELASHCKTYRWLQGAGKKRYAAARKEAKK